LNSGQYIPYNWVKRKEGYILNELLKGNFIATPSIVARKECFQKVGMFDERLPRLQDWELVLRLSKHYEFRIVDEPLLISPLTADSLSTNETARIEALKLIITKHLKDFLKDKETLSGYYYGIGTYECINGDTQEGEDYIWRAFQLIPNKRILAQRYFTIGRRACLRDVRRGRRFLTKALILNPSGVGIYLTFLASLLGNPGYRKVAQVHKKLSSLLNSARTDPK